MGEREGWGGGAGGQTKTFPALFVSIKELVKVLKGSKIRHTAPPFIALNDNVILKPMSKLLRYKSLYKYPPTPLLSYPFILLHKHTLRC